MTLRKRLIVVGDNLMVRPENRTKTSAGLYLPATVGDRDQVATGWVVEVGPGLAYPELVEPDSEPWQRKERKARYVPPQANEGDYAIFMKKAAIEISYEEQKYLIVPNSAVLALLREELGPTGPNPSPISND